MDKMTAELLSQMKTMLDLNKDLNAFAKDNPDQKEKVAKVKGFLDFAAGKCMADIIHNERL